MSKQDKDVRQVGRRDFLRRLKDGTALAGVAAAGAALGGSTGTGDASPAAGTPTRQADAGSYHMSEHIRKYYATSRVF